MRVSLLLPITVALIACTGEGVAPLPEPVTLRCAGGALTGPEMIDQGNLNLTMPGPCGDIVYQSFVAGVSSRTLASPGRDPVAVVGQPRAFSPAGDRLAINGATGQVYDLGTGEAHDLFEGFGELHFLRDLETPPNVYPVGCGEGEVRILDSDGSVRTLATDVISCPAIASHAPILLFQDSDGVLSRLDVSNGEIVRLAEILYSDGRTTFPGSGRNDRLELSSDGEVLVHHQRSWGGGREWATLTRTSDGEVLGAITGADRAFDVTAIPGGHVMAITTGMYLWVLDRNYEFLAYEGLKGRGHLADRRMLVWDERFAELFIFEPGTGIRSEAILDVDTMEDSFRTPQIAISENRRFVAASIRLPCDGSQCVQMVLHDVDAEVSTTLFDDEPDARLQWVTDTGFTVVTGGNRRPDGSYVPWATIYEPSGEVFSERSNQNIGRLASQGPVLMMQTSGADFANNRLERIDTLTGETTELATDVRDFRDGQDRVYYLVVDDPMTGSTTLWAAPF